MKPKDLNRKPSKSRREPKTSRGRATRDDILTAAERLVSERWVHETPFAGLAQAAGVARASLLHAFPHWQDVLYDLFRREMNKLDDAYDAAASLKGVQRGERAYRYLVTVIDRAERSGRLYPNLRSVMFTWHGEYQDDVVLDGPSSPELLGRFALFDLSDHYASVELLLAIEKDPNLRDHELGPQPIGECLVNLALDLAAGSPSYFGDFEGRRQTLQRTIDCMVTGLRHLPTKRRQKKTS